MDFALEAQLQLEAEFESQYADELDALRELENDFDFDLSAGHHASQPKTAATQPGSQNRSQLPTKEKPSSQPGFGVSGDVSGLNSIKNDSSATKDGAVPKGDADLNLDKASSNRTKRKRDMYEMFGIMSDSDSDNELVIDAPSPIKDPKPKRPRKLLERYSTEIKSPVADKLNEIEITPPPTPDKGERTIMQINQQRTVSGRQISSTVSGAGQRSNVKRSLRVFTRQPEGNSVKVTGQDGQRVYLKMKDVESWKNKKSFSTDYGVNSTKGLLTSSYDVLMRQIDDENRRKVIEESTRISEKLRRELAKEYEDDDSEEVTGAKEEDHGGIGKDLWVEKYTPRHFTDLLSDDGVNRNLLFWLKLWDYVVFDKEVKRPKTKTKSEAGNKNFQQQNKFKSKFQQEDLTTELDELNRPKYKVALLCGPPGLGKTTLAHIIARHAGYNVVEMNASDDRSQEVFRERLQSSTQMKAVLSPDQRPNCLVIDEIDGAPQPAINCLLNAIKGGSDQAQQNPSGAKKKKKGQAPLRRPIICICNDVYVPSLRQLRQLAFVTHFPPTLSARLAQRLYLIAKNNCLRTDMTTLVALCNKADNDIRSCLNTLQFLHRQGKPLTLGIVHSLDVGQKDQHKSLYTVWQQLFQLPKPKKKQYTNPHDLKQGQRLGAADSMHGFDSDLTSLTARFHHMLHVIQSCGEHEKLMQGIFENYLEVKFKDPHMDAINLACEYLVFSDRIQTKISKTQNYVFGRFLPYVPLMFHMLFAAVAYPKIRFPNTQYEIKTKTELVSNLVRTMMSEITPRIRRGINLKLAVTELLAPLLIILQPAFRPINTQLFSASEKKQLKELVDTMIAYNLTYHQERSMEGQYNYVLDPNLEVVVRFSDSPPVRQITYAAKQLISREIDLEKMRRSEANLQALNAGRSNSNIKQRTNKPTEGDKGKKEEKKSETTVPRHLQKLQAKKIEITEEEEKPLRDFFGRIIQKPTKETESQDGDDGKDGTQSTDAPQVTKQKARKQLWYNFNAGYTNAVRKNIRIQELL